MKRILLTRSEEENKKIAKELTAFEVVSCPMLFYRKLDVDWQEFKDFSHLIITSKYAAKLVADNYLFKVTAYVVGEESAKLLEQNPNVTLERVFKNIGELFAPHPQGSEANSQDLMIVVEEVCIHPSSRAFASKSVGAPGDKLSPLNKTLTLPHKVPMVGAMHLSQDYGRTLYLSGNHITQEIEGVTRKEIYHTEYADSLDPNLFKDPIDYVLIYSQNSANNLIKLLQDYNLLQKIKNSVTIALSEKLANQVGDYAAEMLYPDNPVADDMIKLLIEYDRKKESSKH